MSSVGHYNESDEDGNQSSKVGIVTTIYRLFRSDSETGRVLRGFAWNLLTFGAFVGTACYVVPSVAGYFRADTNPNGEDYYKESAFKDEQDYLGYRALYTS